jgi:sugar/nucleoside kinase (ribokinase family)
VRAARIVCVGDIVTDVLAALDGPLEHGSDSPARIRVTGGGQAANTAAWLAHLGAEVTLVGAIGDDDAGRDRVAELTAAGVQCAVQVCPGTATGAIVVLSGAGERTMISDRGANLLLDAEWVRSAVAEGGHLHLSAYTLLDSASCGTGLAALDAARELGLTSSVDAASAAPLRAAGAQRFLSWCEGVTVLLANRDEADVLAGPGHPQDQAQKLAGYATSAIVKLGADGAVWAGAHGVVTAPAPAVPVLDTTGAGDAFAAGLLAALVTGRSEMGK